MDAATPFRRSLGLFVLVAAAVGCQSGGGSSYRSQSPQNEPVPGGPVAPVLPAPQAPQAPTATPASFPPPPVGAAAAALAGDPRIKVVAIVGLRNTITDQEV